MSALKRAAPEQADGDQNDAKKVKHDNDDLFKLLGIDPVAIEHAKLRRNQFTSGEFIERATLEPIKHMRWYYADEMMNEHVHDGEVPDNPKTHVAFLDKYSLWRNDMPAWLDMAAKAALTLKKDADIYKAVRLYMRDTFEAIWAYYEADKPEKFTYKYPCDSSIFADFDRLWQSSAVVTLADDSIVFEGQGRSECDLLQAKVGDVVIRKRPTSTTWSLNAATWFAGSEMSGIICVHHIRDTKLRAFLAQEIASRGFGSGWLEAEILLQGGIEITIDSITRDRVQSYNQNRSGECTFDKSNMRIVHTTVKCSSVADA